MDTARRSQLRDALRADADRWAAIIRYLLLISATS
jgi:hypothetical protein